MTDIIHGIPVGSICIVSGQNAKIQVTTYKEWEEQERKKESSHNLTDGILQDWLYDYVPCRLSNGHITGWRARALKVQAKPNGKHFVVTCKVCGGKDVIDDLAASFMDFTCIECKPIPAQSA